VKEDYKMRMIREYRDLKDRRDRLHQLLVKHKAGLLDFELSCPLSLLREQLRIMDDYLTVLEARSILEQVRLDSEVE